MTRIATILAVALLVAVIASSGARAASREACEAMGGVVEPSGRGGGWWKCCLKVPPGILKKGRSTVCFVCNGDAPEGNCDQIPYVDKDKPKPVQPPAKDAGKPK